MRNCGSIAIPIAYVTSAIIPTPLVDNNKVQTGSGDQAPRVVPEVLVVQKHVDFIDFSNTILPGMVVSSRWLQWTMILQSLLVGLN